jgi:hypothetical protein
VEPWDTPPHPGEEHFDVGVWHLSALPADRKNRDGYLMLKQKVYESWCDVEASYSDIAVAAVRAFHEQVIKLVDAIPEQEICSRSWSWLGCCNPVYNLISMVPAVARDMAPQIVALASQYGLVCYDPQTDKLYLPP